MKTKVKQALWEMTIPADSTGLDEKVSVAFSDEYKTMIAVGANDDSLTFSKWLQMVAPEQQQQLIAAASKALKEVDGMNMLDVQYSMFDFDNDRRWFRLSCHVERDGSGHPTRVVGMCNDVGDDVESGASPAQFINYLEF